MFDQLTPHHIQIAAPLVVGLLLLWFFGKFITNYRLPVRGIKRRLKHLTQEILTIKKQAPDLRRAALDQVFRETELAHVWQEFQETLHDQYEVHDGENRVVRTRSTVPAAYFFNSQSIVETPLQIEYFKHLPGILTGVGIIGTFAGLLVGLFYFDPSDPAKVNDSVKLLLNGVRDAFIASAAAIGIAMYVTNSEKKHTRISCSLLEKLNEAIDSLFDAGVGEEYLAALVSASEESAKQTRQLKDSLVTDLREMLQNLVDTQVQESMRLSDTLSVTYKDAGQNMATHISNSIESSFREPLNKIADSVKVASGDQSGKVQNLLQDVMVAFMAELKGTFGQQFSGMQDMLSQSVGAMQQMQNGFSTLIQDMRNASESSGQAVQEQLAKTLQDMQDGQSLMQAAMNEMIANLQTAVASIGAQGEAAGSKMGAQLEKIFAENELRQQVMAEQMHSFVENIKDSVGQGQQATMVRISETVDQLGQQMNGLLASFEQNRIQTDAAAISAQQQLHEGTRSLVGDLNQQVTGTVAQLGQQMNSVMASFEQSRSQSDAAAISAQQQLHEGTSLLIGDLQKQTQSLISLVSDERTATKETIKTLGDQTERTINGMQQGAEKMRSAAEQFESAGESISKTTQATGQVLQQIQGSTGELTAASRELSTIVTDYRANRDALGKTLLTLESITTNAQAEAGMRGQILQDLSTVSERMHTLNQEAAEYLEQVSHILGKGFDDFGAGVERSLSKSLGSLDLELDKAVKALAGGVESLSENIDDLTDTLQKAANIRR